MPYDDNDERDDRDDNRGSRDDDRRSRRAQLTLEEIQIFREMVAERIFYKRLWKFLGWVSAYASGIVAAIWAGREFIAAFFRALSQIK